MLMWGADCCSRGLNCRQGCSSNRSILDVHALQAQSSADDLPAAQAEIAQLKTVLIESESLCRAADAEVAQLKAECVPAPNSAKLAVELPNGTVEEGSLIRFAAMNVPMPWSNAVPAHAQCLSILERGTD